MNPQRVSTHGTWNEPGTVTPPQRFRAAVRAGLSVAAAAVLATTALARAQELGLL